MSYVIISKSDGGVISHKNIDIDTVNLPSDADIYDDESDFESRLSELTSVP